MPTSDPYNASSAPPPINKNYGDVSMPTSDLHPCFFCDHPEAEDYSGSSFPYRELWLCTVCSRLNGTYDFPPGPSNTDVLKAIVKLFHALGVVPEDEVDDAYQ